MSFKVFNSLGNKLEEFKPIQKNHVGLYTCGPTVYNYAHIGNFRAYCWEDILKRHLLFLGYKVTHVMNLTDVDDKTINGARKNNVPLTEFTENYKKAFFEDIKKLNILPANHYPAATNCIHEMVEIVEKLLEQGFAYKSDDGSIYYSIKKFSEYGKLANINTKKLVSGKRIKQDEYEKEGVGDFALWKAWDEQDGVVYWETRLGKGRPGWHIECSAMSKKHLGETFDIHTGGIDNKFPHHENEIAQSEAASGKKFVNYWLHCEHLMVDGKKMSKSLGNFFTLRDLIEQGLNPIAIRYVLINSQYRQPLNFTIESVRDAEKTLDGLQRFIERLDSVKSAEENILVNDLLQDIEKKFVSAMNNNLNVPEAIKNVFELVKKINVLIDENNFGKNNAVVTKSFLKKIDSVLGIMNFSESFFELTEEQEKLLSERKTAKQNKDWARADEIRDLFKKQRIELIDEKDGTIRIKKI